MNLKAVLLLCLVFFAATTVISVSNMSMISTKSLPNTIGAGNLAILDTGFVEPMGDPVDNPVAPD